MLCLILFRSIKKSFRNRTVLSLQNTLWSEMYFSLFGKERISSNGLVTLKGFSDMLGMYGSTLKQWLFSKLHDSNSNESLQRLETSFGLLLI